jgi:ornithine decarboxylase
MNNMKSFLPKEVRSLSLKRKTPFFVFSEKILIDNVRRYQRCLPKNTEITYAMKANSEMCILQALNKMGISFEVSSKYELNLLKKINVPPERIIYGAPVKPIEHIKEFAKYGVDRFAFDSESELFKIAHSAPGSRVYIRILVDDRSNSVFKMSEKFGATKTEIKFLLHKAKELNLITYGVSFNVGSQAKNKLAWSRGIQDVAKILMKLQKEEIRVGIVNIGGGFPQSYQEGDGFPSIEEISKHLNKATKKLPYEVTYIAEPGRGLVANAFALVTTVIGKKKRSNGNWLFLDAGVYNALFEAMIYQGSTKYNAETISSNFGKKESFILSGPTCDNIDVINNKLLLPASTTIDDKIIIYDVGAYTFPLITKFNGFPKPPTINL